jgi:Predicted membrane protein (DUF2207)
MSDYKPHSPATCSASVQAGLLVIFGVFSASLFPFFCPVAAHADEQAPGGMSSFRADVTVKEDARLDVREEIFVSPAGQYYRYGFVRQLPIAPADRWDEKYVGKYKADNGIRIKILQVDENGSKVEYEQGRGYGYQQLRIGPQNVPLSEGGHRYVIHYIVYGALSIGAGRDALYWNAVGHERTDPVAEAVLSIHLPAAIPPTDVQVLESRVGGRGVSNKRTAATDLEQIEDAPGTITYRATHVGPRQSLSLAVSWPSGYIHAPATSFLGPEAWLLAAPTLVFVYYLIAWICVGSEAKPGAVVTRYEPPEGLSAAAVRYVLSTGSDGRSFAAVIAALGSRGCLRVEPQAGKYKLSKLMSDRVTEAKLAPEESRVLKMLFEDGPSTELTPAMDQRNTAQNTRYVFAIQEELNKNLQGLYFTRHSGTIALGVLATVGAALLLAARATGRDASGALFFTTWALGAGLMIGLLLEMTFWPACKTALRSGGGWERLVPGAAAAGAFIWAVVYMLRKLAEGVSLAFALMLAGLILVNLIWGPQFKRRTMLGRKVLDEIAGFRLFLEKVDQDRLDKLNGVDEAPQMLDEHLPYAIALEVKDAWGDHLAGTFVTTSVMR